MEIINVGLANLCVSNKLKKTYFNDSLINESKELANDFLTVIKNSKLLSLEFKVLNNIENKTINEDVAATRYIDSNVKLFETYTIDELNFEHGKIKNFINKDVVDQDKSKLYESIINLISGSISDTETIDVDLIHESFTCILNHIKSDKTVKVNIVESYENINEDIIEIAINKFNEKYVDLCEDDKSLIKKLINADYKAKVAIFEEYKTKTLANIENVSEEKYLSKISMVKTKINEMIINEELIVDNIISLHELNSSLI